MANVADGAAQFRPLDEKSEIGVAAAPICAWVMGHAHV